MSAALLDGLFGAKHGKGELIVVTGDKGAGKSRRIKSMLKKLPAGSRFSHLEWPGFNDAATIRRDLRDGLFVFVETHGDLARFPVKPYRLIIVKAKASA